MRRIAGVALVALVAACGGSDDDGLTPIHPPPPPNAAAVSIIDNAYSPATLSVITGRAVIWTNRGSLNHTVTADDGSFSSLNIGPNEEYFISFNTVGTVGYHCTLHGMTGTIVVTP